jgi:hypothetical protein
MISHIKNISETRKLWIVSGQYMLTSYGYGIWNEQETLIFLSNSDGEIISWIEIGGIARHSHIDAIQMIADRG